MMSYSQLHELALKLQAPDAVVFREYIQLIFLENLYQTKGSENIIFKGGTAVHLMYKAPRFSEDLDFTVVTTEPEFDTIIQVVLEKVSRLYEITFKTRKTITGRRYLLTASPTIIKNNTYINLDFSFRESVALINKSPLDTEYPITITSTICYMDKDEIIAEKIRALLTRVKGRDVYDLAFLLNNHGSINLHLLDSKFDYYQDKDLTLADVPKRLDSFPKKDFVEDLRPFLATSARHNLEDKFEVMKATIKNAVVSAL